MFSFIGRFFKGIKAYFGADFRYYTITFFFFLILLAILAPLFLILEITKLNNIDLIYLIGSSSAVLYVIYMFLTMNSHVRRVFFQTKWKYFFGIAVPVLGTAGLSILISLLVKIFPLQLYYIVTVALLISFFIWLVIQLLVFGLFIRDFNVYLLERIEQNESKQNKRFILFSVIFQIGMVIYLFSLRKSFKDITREIRKNLFQFPFDLWLLPLILIVLSGVILTITLISKKYRAMFFSTSYMLFYNLYLLYHIVYILIYIYDRSGAFVGVINVLSLVIFAFLVFYALQSAAATVKTKVERWWQPISFFLFTIALLYITWSITFLHDLAIHNIADLEYLEIIFWSINHLFSYLLGVLFLIVTVFVFMPRLKRKKEVE